MRNCSALCFHQDSLDLYYVKKTWPQTHLCGQIPFTHGPIEVLLRSQQIKMPAQTWRDGVRISHRIDFGVRPRGIIGSRRAILANTFLRITSIFFCLCRFVLLAMVKSAKRLSVQIVYRLFGEQSLNGTDLVLVHWFNATPQAAPGGITQTREAL